VVALTDEGCFVVNANHLIEAGDSLDKDRLDARCRELDLPLLTGEMLNKETARRPGPAVWTFFQCRLRLPTAITPYVPWAEP
jgi:hypothetical protein